MKQKTVMIFGLVSLLPLLAGCAKEQDALEPEGDARIIVSASVGNPGSKSETGVNYDARFVPGDAIGVFAVKRGADGLPGVLASSGNYIDNAKFVYQDDGTWKEEGSKSYYAEEGEILDFYAYYPYAEGADPVALEYDASERMADFMLARKDWIDSRGEPVDFTFRHVLALAETYIVGADRLFDYSVTMQNVVTSAVFSLAREEGDELVDTGTEKTSVEMSDTCNVFRAWLPPQTVAKGTDLFTVKGKDAAAFVHTVPLDGILSSGSVKKWLVHPSFDRPELLPNSYIVEPGQTIYLPVEKAYSVWESESGLAESGISGQLSAHVAWEDVRYIMNDDQIQILGTGREAVVQVRTTPGTEGNVVVSLSAGDKVRWSWHLWITHYNPLAAESLKTNNGYIFMDRNLGALSSEPGSTDAMGLQYQWGRNNPFPCGKDFSATQIREVWNGYGQKQVFTGKAAVASEQENRYVSVTEPMTIIVGMEDALDWLSLEPDFDRYRWQDSDGNKTAYDPCPYGWKVPGSTDAFLGLSSANCSWNNGAEWTGAGYWPACGINEVKSISWNGACGYYWTAAASEVSHDINGNLIRTSDSFFVDASSTMVDAHYKYYPLNVRCVKE